MIAYKLLRPGRVAPFGGVRWPEPGEWIEVEELDSCRSGIHACRAEELPLWLGLGELWEVELEDVSVEERKLVARRGRLVRRIDAWDAECGRAFAAACAEEAARRAREEPRVTGYARSVALDDDAPAMTAYVVARLAEVHEGPDGYDAERRRQADWLIARLGLSRSD